MARAAARIGGVAAVLGALSWSAAGGSGSAFASSAPYELYCPGTPVGNVVLNGVTTSATITPASPASGQQFNITNYQTNVTLSTALSRAAAAIQSNLEGTAQTTVDVTGASPSSIAGPSVSFNVPITDNGANGVSLALPPSPATVGPFTATGGAITVTQASSSKLGLVVGGNTLSLNCTAYPNNANTPSNGILEGTPAGTATAPVIATATASGTASPTPTTGATTATTAATTATTAATTATTAATTATTAATPSTAADSPLAYTGAGPGLLLAGLLGVLLVGGALALVVADRSRRALLRLLHRGGGPTRH